MNILVISHSCVTDVNQKLFVEINRIPNVAVELLVPSTWINSVTREPFRTRLLDSVNFPVHQIPVFRPGNLSLYCYKYLPKLSELARCPDIVFSTQEPWSLSGLQSNILARRFGATFVFQMNQNILKRYPLPFRWIEQLHFRSAAVAMPSSDEAQQVLIKKGMRIPSVIVPFGIDTEMFRPGRNEQKRTMLGLENNCVLGFVGRLVREKGLDILLRAAAQLRNDAESRKFKILLVGSGPERANLEELAKSLGIADHVVFTGLVPHSDAGRYMQCIDIFVLPSRTTPTWKEQFGRVIIEALACAIPVVGSDSGSIPNLIGDTGGGLVFREDNVDDCADKIRLLLHDDELRGRLGRTGAFAVAERYTMEAVARQIVDVVAAHAPMRELMHA
jgi:glycosyltransferase involved in cell wall biosynthesis